MVGSKILLVDDDNQFVLALKAYLEAVGYGVTSIESAEHAMDELRRYHYDLMVLDLTLPDEDGLCLLRKIRNQKDIPIIIISGRSTDEDRIAGLELGADDYLTKPFSPKELVLRIKKRLSLEAQGSNKVAERSTVHFGNWTLDKDSLRVFNRSGQEPDLTPRELDILSTLAKHIGHVMSREQLIDASLQLRGPESNRAIDVAISRLRSKLEDNPHEPSLIKTVKGFGYKLIGSDDL